MSKRVKIQVEFETEVTDKESQLDDETIIEAYKDTWFDALDDANFDDKVKVSVELVDAA